MLEQARNIENLNTERKQVVGYMIIQVLPTKEYKLYFGISNQIKGYE